MCLYRDPDASASLSMTELVVIVISNEYLHMKVINLSAVIQTEGKDPGQIEDHSPREPLVSVLGPGCFGGPQHDGARGYCN